MLYQPLSRAVLEVRTQNGSIDAFVFHSDGAIQFDVWRLHAAGQPQPCETIPTSPVPLRLISAGRSGLDPIESLFQKPKIL